MKHKSCMILELIYSNSMSVLVLVLVLALDLNQGHAVLQKASNMFGCDFERTYENGIN